MQAQGIAVEPGTSVSGLGVCDVWRLDLSAAQPPWLVDELEALRGPLEEALQRATAKQVREPSDATADEVSAREYELRLLRMMREQLPARTSRDAVVFVGPTELVRELVAGALRNAIDALSELVDEQHLNDTEARARLMEVADAACAWARTFAECQELEAFSFDSTADPVSLR